MHAENTASTPEKLAVSLLTSLFTHDEIAQGNCTTPIRTDIVLLDQLKVQAIRGNSEKGTYHNPCLILYLCRGGSGGGGGCRGAHPPTPPPPPPEPPLLTCNWSVALSTPYMQVMASSIIIGCLFTP